MPKSKSKTKRDTAGVNVEDKKINNFWQHLKILKKNKEWIKIYPLLIFIAAQFVGYDCI